jgi:hypothetical protein
MSDDDVVLKSVWLPRDPPRAFTLFTERIHDWWPPERRHIQGGDSVVELSPQRFWERAVDGREVELGQVRAWEEPTRIVLDFYPGTDRDHPTVVTVTFVAERNGTQVIVEHRPTVASAALWHARVSAFVRSWDVVLPALQRAAHDDTRGA